MGANPFIAIDQARKRLGLNIAPVQIPIGSDSKLSGLVDLIKMKGYEFEGKNGEIIKEINIPSNIMELAQNKR